MATHKHNDPDLSQVLAEADAERQTFKAEPEVYLGRSPAAQEELDHKLDELEKRAQTTEREAFLASQVNELREQFNRQQELIAGLLKTNASKPLDEVARAVSAWEHMRARQRNYERIIKESNGMVTIMVHSNGDDLSRNWDVPVSVNGKCWKLKRGEEIRVPVCVMEVLDNARVTSQVRLVDSDGNVRVEHMDMLSYPYTKLSEG